MRISSSKPAWAKLVRPYLKNKNKPKKAGYVAQVVEPLSSKPKTLGSIPNTTFKKKIKKVMRT
jgi:hypothetical protein